MMNPWQTKQNLLVLMAVFFAISLVSISTAEEFQLRTQQAPYYVGEPVVIQVVAKGFTGSTEPKCRLVGSLANGIEVSGPQVSQSFSRFMQLNFGGRTATQETANYTFQFLVTASSAGEYAVGPFQLEYAGRKEIVGATTLVFTHLEDDPNMMMSVRIPGETLYVGQRIPITISWASAGEIHEIQYAFRNLEIRSPLFDQFEFEDVQPKTSTTLTIATAKGLVSVDATQSQERRDGKDFLVLTSRSMMKLNSIGRFESIPVTCRTKRGSGWRREFFGGVQPSRSRPAIASGKPLSFTVNPLPEDGRPASFAGAIGSGYSIEISANRTVVRVGDPISLNVALRGEGLEKMSLPDLTADGGLPPDQFQLPSEPLAGHYNGKTKQFKVNVRVKDESVNQIPGLPFSWFDPRKEQYITARSKPIALQVIPAQVLDADDVISASKPEQNILSATQENTRRKTLIAGGANLAIERDVEKLVSPSNGMLASSTVRLGSYVLGISAILVAVFVRCRSEVDPAISERRQKIKSWRQRIVDAAKLSGKEAAEQIASNLRKFVTIADDSQRSQLNELIARCEEDIYAPHENGSTNDLTKLALQLVDSIRV